MSDKYKIALLIDCDNISHTSIEGVLADLAKYGTVNVRHAHGNWNSQRLAGWREQLQTHAIKPIQQFAYTTGKNATDASMIIDAMDLLYSGHIDAFALMTSDSDFTPLALRIRESGLPVYGFGEQKTPKAFVDACSTFIYVENFNNKVNETMDAPEKPSKKSKHDLNRDAELVKSLRTAIEQSLDDDGWANMSKVAQYLKNTGFSSVNYGYKRTSDLIKETGLFKIEMRGTVMHIKNVKTSSTKLIPSKNA